MIQDMSLLHAAAPRTSPTHEFVNPALRKMSSHLSLDEDEMAELDHILALGMRAYPAGTSLVRQGEPARELMIVISGWACRVKQGAGRQIVALHLPGDLCDLHALLTRRADCAIEALSDVQVACISQRGLNDIARRLPRVSQALWSEALASAAIQREWMVNVAGRKALARYCHLLCELHHRLHAVGLTDQGRFEVPARQVDLGNACGLTAETSSRIVKNLKDSGIIAIERGAMQILDHDRLTSFGAFNSGYLIQMT